MDTNILLSKVWIMNYEYKYIVLLNAGYKYTAKQSMDTNKL